MYVIQCLFYTQEQYVIKLFLPKLKKVSSGDHELLVLYCSCALRAQISCLKVYFMGTRLGLTAAQ